MHRAALALVGAAWLAAVPAAWSQSRADMDARDLFYEPADPGLDDSDAWLGLRTNILLSYTTRDGEERQRLVSDFEEFRSGDRVRIQVQANVAGHLYVFAKDSYGEVNLLFPNEEDRANRIARFRSRSVPERDWLRFDNEPGREQLYLFLSRQKIRELERAAGRNSRFDARDLEDFLAEAGDNPNRIYDEDCGPTRPTFYVEKPSSRRDFLVRRFDLKHR